MVAPAHKRVLLFDRDPSSARVAQAVQSRHPVEIAVAHDMVEAVEQIEKGDLGLVVVDAERPKQAGLELLEWMEGHHVQVPVLIASATADSPRLLSQYPDLVQIFERKPMSVALLEDMVQLYAE